jgi:hypothetical protein
MLISREQENPWLVIDGWCWFVMREKYCWLITSGWFVLRENTAGWWLISQANRALAGALSAAEQWSSSPSSHRQVGTSTSVAYPAPPPPPSPATTTTTSTGSSSSVQRRPHQDAGAGDAGRSSDVGRECLMAGAAGRGHVWLGESKKLRLGNLACMKY